MHLVNDVDRFPEWVATISFYKAVHVIEAVFANTLNKHSMSHDDRRQTLKTLQFKKIFNPYDRLLNASRVARYLEDKSTESNYSEFTDYMTSETVKNKLVKKYLRFVEQESIKFLSDDQRKQLIKIDHISIA